MKMLGDLDALLDDFRKVAALAGTPLPPEALSIGWHPAPHDPPPPLQNGKMAVYVFIRNDVCLKVGKVGPKSHARFTSQHYNSSSSSSNLAKSLIARQREIDETCITDSNVGDWIKANVDRVNFFLSSENNIFVLGLLEAFLQCRLQPKFEGFKSQR